MPPLTSITVSWPRNFPVEDRATALQTANRCCEKVGRDQQAIVAKIVCSSYWWLSKGQEQVGAFAEKHNPWSAGHCIGETLTRCGDGNTEETVSLMRERLDSTSAIVIDRAKSV